MRRSVKDIELDYNKVASFVIKRLRERKYILRPVELEYGKISRCVGLSYKQVRKAFDKMVARRVIEKFQKFDKTFRQVNYYRLI